MLLLDPSTRLGGALALSTFLHAVIIFGVTFKHADPRLFNNWAQPLEVVLVNSKSRTKPEKADALAQARLDGGGNTDEDRRAKSPLPVLSQDTRTVEESQARKKVADLEREAARLMTQVRSKQAVETAERPPEKTEQAGEGQTADLIQRSLQIARLEAQIAKDWDAYQKRPRRRFVGARTQEFRFAQYIEDWRVKIERIGTVNYPEAAKQHRIFGSLQLTVAIRHDGTVESVEINRSSGQKVLDQAALRIVELSGPYAPFPPDIRGDTDILHITRTWTFTRNDQLVAE